MKPKVLLFRVFPSIAKEVLQEHFDVIENKEPLTHKQFFQIAPLYDAFLTSCNDHISKRIIQKATRLKVISNYGVGLDNIDLDAAKEQGVKVYNLPDIVTTATAEMTFALMFALLRHIPSSFDHIKQGKWNQWAPSSFIGEQLEDKKLGIFGYGRIGNAVAQRAISFKMSILAHRRSPLLPKERFKGLEQVDLKTLQTQSDILCLLCPLTQATHNMIDLPFLQKMKPTSFLINMARGPIIKTDDLQIALEKKIIQGAALDVTDPEPLGDHPIKNLDNIIITPHLGTATKKCRYQMAKKAAQNIIEGYQVYSAI